MADKPKPKPPVGYRRPPVEHRFQKGTSGNPKGRPKKTPKQVAHDALLLGYEKIIARESRREIKIHEDGKTAKITMYDAAVRRLHIDAAKGVPSAINKVLKLRQDVETSVYEQQKELLFAVLERKAEWERTVDQAERENRQLSKVPAPHPDDIVIDYRTMNIRYNGPENPQQERGWKQVIEQAEGYAAEAERLTAMAKRSRTLKAELEDEAAWNAKMGAMLTAYFPSEEVRRRVGFDLIRWRQVEPLCQEFEAMLKRRRRMKTANRDERRSRRL